MILGGDELGRTQFGNNNAYCQDNEIGWIDWRTPTRSFTGFTRRMIAFRKDHPVLRQSLFLHSRERALDGAPDLFWRNADGVPMEARTGMTRICVLCASKCARRRVHRHYAALEYAVFIVFNAGPGAGWSSPTRRPVSLVGADRHRLSGRARGPGQGQPDQRCREFRCGSGAGTRRLRDRNIPWNT